MQLISSTQPLPSFISCMGKVSLSIRILTKSTKVICSCMMNQMEMIGADTMGVNPHLR